MSFKRTTCRAVVVGLALLVCAHAARGRQLSQASAQLDAGTEQGVKDKMVFRAARRDEAETPVVVLRAGRRRSTAVVVGELDERGRAARPEQLRSKAARGWKLTTSPF